MFAKQPHLISAAVRYAESSYGDLLVCSPKPELAWLHSASVVTVVELLVLTGFGASPSFASAAAPKADEIGQLVTALLKPSFERGHVLRNACLPFPPSSGTLMNV